MEEEDKPAARRARWSLESASPRWSSSCSLLHRSSPPYPLLPLPPSPPCRRLRLWEDSAKSQLAVSGSGKTLAVTGAHNSVQLLNITSLLGKSTDTEGEVTSEGQRLVGHSAPVTSADFSRTGDWLATAGEDRTVKIWDWRSRRVVMDVDSRRGGFYEEGYGVAKKVSKDAPVFAEAVTKSRFFYLDSLLLSSSANKLLVHSVRLPARQGEPGHFRLSKTVSFPECRTVSTLACVNQFYSFLAFVACSDRSVRVYDLNQSAVVRTLPRCHPRTTHRICLSEGSPGVSHPERGYDLFVTAALGDGAKLWDLRETDCVQKFDSVRNVKHQCGVALSPCLRFLAAAGEDGSVTVFDTRRVAGPLARIVTGSQVVSDVVFSPRQPLLLAAGLDGAVMSYTV